MSRPARAVPVSRFQKVSAVVRFRYRATLCPSFSRMFCIRAAGTSLRHEPTNRPASRSGRVHPQPVQGAGPVAEFEGAPGALHVRARGHRPRIDGVCPAPGAAAGAPGAGGAA